MNLLFSPPFRKRSWLHSDSGKWSKIRDDNRAKAACQLKEEVGLMSAYVTKMFPSLYSPRISMHLINMKTTASSPPLLVPYKAHPNLRIPLCSQTGVLCAFRSSSGLPLTASWTLLCWIPLVPSTLALPIPNHTTLIFLDCYLQTSPSPDELLTLTSSPLKSFIPMTEERPMLKWEKDFSL